MHQSLVSTIPPPTGMGGDNDFHFPEPWYKPRTVGNKLMITTLLFASPYTIENPSRVYVSFPMLYPHTSPALRGQSKRNCPAPNPGYPTAIPVGGAWIQMTGALSSLNIV